MTLSVGGLILAISRVFAADLGPIFDDFPLTLANGHRIEAAGPLFFFEEKENAHTWAVPPLFSFTKDPSVEMEEIDFIYPLLTYDRYGDQYRWQFFQLLSFAGGPTQVENARDRFTIFPFYFQQRSSDTSQNYTAVFPFYGHLRNRLFRDEISFILFPFYGESRKKDVVTDNYLYPFFHLRHGDGLEGWQLWPLYGEEHKEVTLRTNRFGDIQTVPGHDRMFALWPFFFKELNGIGTTNQESRHGSLLIYSVQRSPLRDSTGALLLFSHVTDREKKYREWDVPWPLIEFARGEGKTVNRVWPIFSHAHTPTLASEFYLWPVYRHTHFHSEPLDRERMRILFFLYSDMTEKNTETGHSRRKLDCWPLFTRRRDYNGDTRLQVLALLEPILAGSHKIERDYSPVWSLWRSEKNGRTGAKSRSLLWNLYRHDSAGATRNTTAVFGLYHRETTADGKSLRLFYIPVTKTKSAPVSGAPQ